MTTDLKKPVRRRTVDLIRRDRGKFRKYIITLFPGDVVGFRLEGTRKTELLPIGVGYETAVRLRVAKEKADKKKARAVKRRFG